MLIAGQYLTTLLLTYGREPSLEPVKHVMNVAREVANLFLEKGGILQNEVRAHMRMALAAITEDQWEQETMSAIMETIEHQYPLSRYPICEESSELSS